MREGVLYTLAQAAFAGEPELATAPASALDPLLRPLARAQVRASIRAARAATQVADDEHVLRLAFLLRLGGLAPGLSPDDQRGVRAAFESEAKRYEEVRPPSRKLTLAVVALLAVLGAGVAALLLRAPASARFLDSPLGVALATPLTEFSLADETKKREKARAELLGDGVKSQLGKENAALFEATLDALDDFQRSKAPFEQAADELAQKTDALDEALEKASIPAFLVAEPREGQLGARTSALFALHVRERADVSVRGASVKVVWGYRLDNLGAGWFTVSRAVGSSWALVNLDIVSEAWSDLLAPVVVREKPSPFGGKDSPEDARALEKVLRTALREELRTCVGLDDGTVLRLTDAVEQRDSRYEILKQKFKFHRSTSSVFQTPAARNLLVKMGDDPLIEQALSWDARLRSDFEPLTKAIEPIALVEEESAIYGMLAKEKLLPEIEVDADDQAVSGTLAVLSHPRRCYRFDLAYVLFDGVRFWNDWGPGHRAVVAFAALLEELGLPGRSEWLGKKGLDKNAASSALAKVMERSPEEVQAAARRAYKKLFGVDPADYVRKVR